MGTSDAYEIEFYIPVEVFYNPALKLVDKMIYTFIQSAETNRYLTPEEDRYINPATKTKQETIEEVSKVLNIKEEVVKKSFRRLHKFHYIQKIKAPPKNHDEYDEWKEHSYCKSYYEINIDMYEIYSSISKQYEEHPENFFQHFNTQSFSDMS